MARSLAGRPALLDAVLAALDGGGRHGVLLVGGMGTGKTALAAEAARRCGEPGPVVRLAGSPSLARVPFAVLAPYLAEVGVGQTISSLFAIRSLQRHFEAAGRSARPIAVVDDAHQIDPDSLAVLAQLVAAGTMRALFTSPPRSAIPQEVLELWTDGFLERFDLPPLTEAEIRDVCTATLGGTVLPAVSAVLGRSSEGNPLYLQSLLATGLQEGNIVRRNGVWMFDGAPPAAGSQALDLVKMELLQRSEAEREVLAAVALAGPVPLEVLTEAGLAAELDVLETEDLIEVEPGAGHLVRVSHPLHRDVLRRLAAGPRSTALHRRLAPFLDRCPASAERLVRLARWSLDCGDPMPAAQLVEAARTAVALCDPGSALRLAAAVTDPDCLEAARLAAAQAHRLAGEVRIAADLADELLDHAADPAVLYGAVVLASGIAAGRGSREHARVGQAWKRVQARCGRASGQDLGGRVPGGQDLAGLDCMAQVLEARTLMLEGRYREAEELLRSLEPDFSVLPVNRPPDAGDDGGACRTLARDLLAEVLAATGRTETAAAFTAQTLTAQTLTAQTLTAQTLTAPALTARTFTAQSSPPTVQSGATGPSGMPVPSLPAGAGTPDFDHLLTGHLLCLLLAGQWDRADRLLGDYRNRGGTNLVYYGGTVHLLQGVLLVLRGRARSGLAVLAPAVESLRGHDPEHLLPLGLGFAAYAAALTGDRDAAGHYADGFSQLRDRGSHYLHLIGEAHVLAARALLDDGGPALHALAGLARQARALSAHTPERFILVLLVRAGQHAWLPRLADLVAELEGPEARLLHGYAVQLQNIQMQNTALHNKDLQNAEPLEASPLAVLAQRATTEGFPLLAVECMAHAVQRQSLQRPCEVQRADGPGDRRDAALALARLRELRAAVEIPADAVSRAVDGSMELTAREREIVELARQGHGNREIARILCLSSRTVEGHIYRIFAKLGISRREELRTVPLPPA